MSWQVLKYQYKVFTMNRTNHDSYCIRLIIDFSLMMLRVVISKSYGELIYLW
jgi:hypothetical protein